MGEFFKPWRRKLGVVTLVLACVFTAGWVRSLSRVNYIGIFSGVRTSHTVISTHGIIGIQHFRHGTTNRWLGARTFIDWGERADILLSELPPSPSNVYWGQGTRLGVILAYDSQNNPIWDYLGPENQAELTSVSDLKWIAKSRINWWCLRFLISFGDYPTDSAGDQFTIWFVPYGSIVIPLTLISIYLLFSRPRSSKSKMPMQPIPETVA
jgi:hypothetical protein